MPELVTDRQIARSTLTAIVRALGHDPDQVVAIRIEHPYVAVWLLAAPGEQPRLVHHPIREDR